MTRIIFAQALTIAPTSRRFPRIGWGGKELNQFKNGHVKSLKIVKKG
ncbi:MAG: hypothetical protein H8D87_20710 [Deltaproteobacteria bacterium]|nr:hypothetical protein [Candidatus Desulfobacula maris]